MLIDPFMWRQFVALSERYGFVGASRCGVKSKRNEKDRAYVEGADTWELVCCACCGCMFDHCVAMWHALTMVGRAGATRSWDAITSAPHLTHTHLHRCTP